MPTNLPLIPGTLATNCYPADPQTLYNEMMEKGVALAGDLQGVIISATEPDPEDRDKAWIKLTAAGGPPTLSLPLVWYNGKWVARHPEDPSGDARRPFVGTLAAVDTYDGGTAGAVTDVSGPMWEVDHDFDARFPVGPGTLPSTTVIAVGDTGGEETHVLTEAEGAVGAHTHFYGITDPTASAAAFAKGISTTVPAYTGRYIGGNSALDFPETTADLMTLKSGPAGAGVTGIGHNNLPPFKGAYFLKRTARIFYVG